MLQLVDVGERSIFQYRGIAPDSILDELIQLSVELAGVRVLHINATPYGGGVSELLRSLVPIENSLGLVVDWRTVSGNGDFFAITKKLHNALQGAPISFMPEEKNAYIDSNKANAEALTSQADVVFVHDPQPAALLHSLQRKWATWIWRCHIDTSQAYLPAWEFLKPFVAEYDAAVFTMKEFVPPDFPVNRVEIVPPAIDPLSPKNFEIGPQLAKEILEWVGVRTNFPLVTQVSRFDHWKDPKGVIEAFKLAREEIPNLRLALVGSMALDDPEGWDVYEEIHALASSDDIHVFTNFTGVGNIEVNAFQRLSRVVVQKSIREGFGLVVSEALWKGTPVVAGRAGGIPLQMPEGVGGLLVTSVEECARGIVSLIKDKDRAAYLAAQGKERVQSEFLLPRLVLDEFKLIKAILGKRKL